MKRVLKIGVALLCGAMAACSTTSRLTDGEVLYTGVKKIDIKPDSGVVLSSDVVSAVKEPLSVAPNNPLYAPYWRTPFPIGLWAYNHLYTPKEKGFRYWLYRKLSKTPILISKVQPEYRAKYVLDQLSQFGYFDASATYELLPRRNPKKAKVSYHVRVGEPSCYSSIEYLDFGGVGTSLVDSLRKTSLLRSGAQYNADSMSLERNRVASILRDRGYYYFRPEYIGYLADTSLAARRVALRMWLRPGAPPAVLVPYKVGRVTVRLMQPNRGPVDTLHISGMEVITQQPMKIRPRLLSKSIKVRSDDLLTVKRQTETQNALNSLGIFRSVNMGVTSLDSLKGTDRADVNISATFDYPIEAEFETNVTSKSNSFLGPGMQLTLSNNNLFRGGEVLSLRLNGNYEWETGKKNTDGGSVRLNSYEFGLSASLDLKRLLLPRWMIRRNPYPARTSFQIGADLMNRPKFFRMMSFDISTEYDFQSSANSYHTLSLLKLVYNNLLHTTASFDQTMAENPAIALSFKDQFIPSMSYAYTFDKMYGPDRLFWKNTVSSAGNLFYLAWELSGDHGTKELFGNRFAQFVKNVSELKFYQQVGRKQNMIAYRFLVGVGYAYGNMNVLPYSEQFYIGGANSIRAFTVRTLGPGSYRPPESNRNGYLDQTGDFKLEANVEFRFGLMGRLNGAVFLDAGNIWLLRNDPQRSGGELRWKGFWKQIALGTGVGLRYDISYLVLRLDLGIALHTPYPNPDKPGYYNISSFRDGLGLHLAIGYPI